MRSLESIIQDRFGFAKDSEHQLLMAQELELVRKAVAQFEPFYQHLFCWRFEEDLRPIQIAEFMGESSNYVNVYLNKLRNNLRRRLRRKPHRN